MNETALEQFRQRLLRLRTELLTREEEAKQSAGRIEPTEQHSMRDVMRAHLKAHAATQGPKRQQEKIDGAFRRMKTGDYGNCFVCGGEIENNRLLEDPTCTRCIQCVEPSLDRE